MTGFTDPFGGSSIQPAEVSYRAVALSTNLVLEWPPASEANAIARVLDVTPSGAGLSLTLPDATAVSPGYDFLINNLGANSFDVKDASGGSLVTVFTGESKYLLLRVASTPAGAWRVIAFGAQTSAADPLALAGLGLTPNATKLDVSLQTVSFSAPYVLTMADRTKNFVWTGGVGTLTLLTSASVGQYFFFEIANRGTGVLTINTSGGDLINGQASQTFQPGDSAFVLADGASGWYTVGMGRNQQFNFTLLSKAISTGNYTLTPTEAANVVQKYTGVLVANVTITLPSVVQVYYVSNQTTGAFSVTFKTAGVGTTVVVPTGQNAVLFCDGTNVLNNSTTVSGFTSLQLAVGSAASPSLSYIGDAASGLFQPTTSTLAVSTGGTERMRWANALATLATPLSVTGAVTATGVYTGPLGAVGAPTYTFAGDTNTGMWSAGADDIQFSAGGSSRLQISTTRVWSVVQMAGSLGAVGAPGFSFAGDANTGWWSPSADVQAWSNGGTERARLDAAGLLTLSHTSSGGVKFANVDNTDTTVLDWFEDYGSFTPAITFGGAAVGVTYTTQVGRYTRIGRMVFYVGQLVLSNKGSSTGQVLITGLPYVASEGSAGNVIGGAATFSALTGGMFSVNSGSSLQVRQENSTGNAGLINNTNCTNTSAFTFSGFYHAA